MADMTEHMPSPTVKESHFPLQHVVLSIFAF